MTQANPAPLTSIAIVIVSFNTRELLRQCLASISPADADAIVVIDNGSTDGSQAMVRAQFPNVRLLESATNLGYGGAANVAIAHCATDYVLLLNSDTVLGPHCARALQQYLDRNPQCALAGPRLHNIDGSLQPSCYPEPTALQLFLDESMIGRLAGYISPLRARNLRTWAHDRARAVPWVLGAALAIRREPFMNVLGFDPTFFMYFEECDLCRRLRDQGWRVDFAPVTTIVHIGGASTRQHKAQMQRELIRSTLHYYARHFAPVQRHLYLVLMTPVVMARIVRGLWRVRFAQGQTPHNDNAETLAAQMGMLHALWLRRDGVDRTRGINAHSQPHATDQRARMIGHGRTDARGVGWWRR